MTIMEERRPTATHVEELARLKRQVHEGPGERATSAQHARGKLTARERIQLLMDEGTFNEVEPLRRHRATGFGLESKPPVHGRRGHRLGHRARPHGLRLRPRLPHLRRLAGRGPRREDPQDHGHGHDGRCPAGLLNDGAGARIQEGVSALAGYGGIFQRNTRASGVIPQISVMLGPCAGGAAYSPALTDFVFMVRETSQMFITGPDVVKAVTGEEVTHDELGGADVHAETSGVAHFAYDDEETCLARRPLPALDAAAEQPRRPAPGGPRRPRRTGAPTPCWTWSPRTATGPTT